MKAEDQSDDDDAICPYCERHHYMEAEDYATDGAVMDCGQCGLKFHLTTEYTVKHFTNGDCELNGETHEWRTPYALHPNLSECATCRKVKIGEVKR